MKPWIFLLIATAIQFAATESASTFTEDNIKGLTDKLDELHRKLDLATESLKKLEDHQNETAAYLQILEHDQKESLHTLERHQNEITASLQTMGHLEKKATEFLKNFEDHQNETATSLQILGHQGKESTESLEKLEDHQNETATSLQILGHQGKESTESLEKSEDHQNETAASPQILERHRNESTPLPSSCVQVFERSHQGSGVYKINLPKSNLGPFEVYCLEDPQGGLPWTVVQRRVDGSTDFYRYWAEYKRGFGNLSTNFFIGLDKLHLLTNQNESQELWVKLTDNVTAHAYYTHFAIGNLYEKYPLKVLGVYSGDAGDALRIHEAMKFTTRDYDNSVYSYDNCAEVCKGAWWYKGCQNSNLNGVYGSTEFQEGVNWHHFRGDEVSMKYAHMAIRPARK